MENIIEEDNQLINKKTNRKKCIKKNLKSQKEI
jgi:hypothetical protein